VHSVTAVSAQFFSQFLLNDFNFTWLSPLRAGFELSLCLLSSMECYG